jgi:hypothetical protein
MAMATSMMAGVRKVLLNNVYALIFSVNLRIPVPLC